MKYSDGILSIIKDAEIKLNVLKNTWPCGIRSIDDETDLKIEKTKQFIEFIKATRGEL